MKFLSTWLRNSHRDRHDFGVAGRSSMKFLSTWLRNLEKRGREASRSFFLNEVPEHMAQECGAPP